MRDRVVEITVEGDAASEAADAIALGLMAAGALVDYPGRVNRAAASHGALRITRAVIRLGAMHAGVASPNSRGLNVSQIAKAATGALLLLMLLGAEVRLHFGPRLDTFLTGFAVLLFWSTCRKPKRSVLL